MLGFANHGSMKQKFCALILPAEKQRENWDSNNFSQDRTKSSMVHGNI
jgi:hypothetical protein